MHSPCSRVLGYLKIANVLDEKRLEAVKEGKWLNTSQGYSAPRGSVLLPDGVEAEAILGITNIVVIEEGFYGSKISTFLTELGLLGVPSNMEQVYNLVTENVLSPLKLTSVNRSGAFLILACIQFSGSASSAMVGKVRNQPWLTSSGAKCPVESILPDPGRSHLLNGIDIPIIYETTYGDKIRSFMGELKAV